MTKNGVIQRDLRDKCKERKRKTITLNNKKKQRINICLYNTHARRIKLLKFLPPTTKNPPISKLKQNVVLILLYFFYIHIQINKSVENIFEPLIKINRSGTRTLIETMEYSSAKKNILRRYIREAAFFFFSYLCQWLHFP